jgi:hypothetical protein
MQQHHSGWHRLMPPGKRTNQVNVRVGSSRRLPSPPVQTMPEKRGQRLQSSSFSLRPPVMQKPSRS